MKNAEGFKFMSYERPNHFSGQAARGGYHQGKQQPWSQLGAAESTNQKDRTKSNQLGGGNQLTGGNKAKYRPK